MKRAWLGLVAGVATTAIVIACSSGGDTSPGNSGGGGTDGSTAQLNDASSGGASSGSPGAPDGSDGSTAGGGPTITQGAKLTFPIAAGGGGLANMAFDLAHHAFWVAAYGAGGGGAPGAVYKVDATSNVVSAPVAGTSYGDLAVVPSQNKVYQRSFANGSPQPLVTVIDGATSTVKTTITTTNAGFPAAIAADKKNNKVYVLTTGAKSFVAVIDATTDTVVQSLEITASKLNGSALAVDPMNGSVYAVGTIADSSPAGKSINVVTLTGSPLTVGSTTKVGPNALVAGFTAVPGSYVVALRDDAPNVTDTHVLYVGTKAITLPFVPFTAKAYTSEGGTWRIAVGGADETGGNSAAKAELAVLDATGTILTSLLVPGAPEHLGAGVIAPVDAVDDEYMIGFIPDTFFGLTPDETAFLYALNHL